MTSISGISLSELEKLLSPLPRFRAQQIYKWIIKGVNTYEEMSNIPVVLQNELKNKYTLYSSNIQSRHSDTNTEKIVITLKDGLKIEAVLLNDKKNRLTACLSTQVGCPCGCLFCKTGSMKLSRNLDSDEIVEQFLHLKNIAEKEKKDGHIIDNIVIMGMGEPLLNLDNLRKAIDIFSDTKGLNLSKRRITISTCGICEGLFEIANNNPNLRLALSLTTADESLRLKLMPISKTNPLKSVKDALKLYQKNGGSRITLEIPLLGGINTGKKDASEIAGFAKGLETVINLIPWNPVKDLEFEGNPLREPSKEEIYNFKDMLESHKLKVTMRLHKGKKINGACGQLGSTAS